MNGSAAESQGQSNGTGNTPPASANGHPASGFTNYIQSPEKKSPSSSSSKGKDGPQDIPSDKVGFGEDMRALKVLDRAFKT